MRILGIDPGYAIVGYGFVDFQKNNYNPAAYGAITTDANQEFNHRLATIYDDMTLLLSKYKPDAVSIEKLFFHNNQKTAIGVAEARGVILLACVKAGVEIFEYTPLQVKMAITGYGRAQKSQIMEMIQRLLSLSVMPKPDDTADALGLAICHGQAAGSELRRTILRGQLMRKP